MEERQLQINDYVKTKKAPLVEGRIVKIEKNKDSSNLYIIVSNLTKLIYKQDELVLDPTKKFKCYKKKYPTYKNRYISSWKKLFFIETGIPVDGETDEEFLKKNKQWIDDNFSDIRGLNEIRRLNL